jgi:hypothetical protein
MCLFAIKFGWFLFVFCFVFKASKLEALLSNIANHSEDPYEFVPRAISIEEEAKRANHLPVSQPPSLAPGLFSELNIIKLQQAVESLDLSPDARVASPLHRPMNALSVSSPVPVDSKTERSCNYHVKSSGSISSTPTHNKSSDSDSTPINPYSNNNTNNNNNSNRWLTNPSPSLVWGHSYPAEESPAVALSPSSQWRDPLRHISEELASSSLVVGDHLAYLHRAPSHNFVFDHLHQQHLQQAPYFLPQHPQQQQQRQQQQYVAQQQPAQQALVFPSDPYSNLYIPFVSVPPAAYNYGAPGM